MCSKCGIEKPLDQFKQTKSGYKITYSRSCLLCKPLVKTNRHNLTKDQINLIIELQYHKCRICQVQNDKLVLDHSHITGKVRAALCQKCNVRLGHLESILEDNLLDNYLEYIDKYKQQEGVLNIGKY